MRYITLSFASLSLLGFAACSSSTPSTGSTAPVAAAPATDAANAAADSAGGVATLTGAQVTKMLAQFSRVHFDFDSTSLNEESRQALAANAKVLLDHRAVVVEVQGHADDRGTSEYNISLGERRAQAVAKYLTTSGIESSRIRVISYGEEKPMEMGAGPGAWSKNRRAEFRVLDGRDAAEGTID